jgi:hypothetical protein
VNEECGDGEMWDHKCCVTVCVFVIEDRGDGEGVGSEVLCHIHNT